MAAYPGGMEPGGMPRGGPRGGIPRGGIPYLAAYHVHTYAAVGHAGFETWLARKLLP